MKLFNTVTVLALVLANPAFADDSQEKILKRALSTLSKNQQMIYAELENDVVWKKANAERIIFVHRGAKGEVNTGSKEYKAFQEAEKLQLKAKNEIIAQADVAPSARRFNFLPKQSQATLVRKQFLMEEKIEARVRQDIGSLGKGLQSEHSRLERDAVLRWKERARYLTSGRADTTPRFRAEEASVKAGQALENFRLEIMSKSIPDPKDTRMNVAIYEKIKADFAQKSEAARAFAAKTSFVERSAALDAEALLAKNRLLRYEAGLEKIGQKAYFGKIYKKIGVTGAAITLSLGIADAANSKSAVIESKNYASKAPASKLESQSEVVQTSLDAQ